MATLGRPLKFKSVKILQEKIDEYFKKIEEEKGVPTITGLALALNTSRETLCDYQGKKSFSDTIKRAKLRCEHAIEVGMLTGKMNATGCIFNLKNNYKWEDVQKIVDPRTEKIDEVREQLNAMINEESNKGASRSVQDRGEERERSSDNRTD